VKTFISFLKNCYLFVEGITFLKEKQKSYTKMGYLRLFLLINKNHNNKRLIKKTITKRHNSSSINYKLAKIQNK